MKRALLAILVGSFVSAANAEYTGPGVTVPFLAANGANTSVSDLSRFSHVINVVDDFGAKGDGATDDWAAIQRAEGMSASGYCTFTQPTLVVVPPTVVNKYRISQAIRRCPWVVLFVQSNATEIDFSGDASGADYTGASNLGQWPNYGATLSGAVVAGSGLPTYALSGALNIGAMSVTLTTPANTSNLVVGDLVDIETTASYNYGGAEPVGVKMALVSALNATTGMVSLDRPMDFASSSVQLRKITNGAGTANWPTWGTGLVFYGTHHSGVIGGRWVATGSAPYYQPFDGGGGCLDCVTAPDEVIAATGVGYGNLFQDSTFSVRREKISGAAFELAYHSSGNTTTIGDIQAIGRPSTIPASGWVAGFDEGSHDNKLSVSRIEDYTGDVAAEWLLVGAVSPGGGDALTTTLYTPAALSATVNGGGSGYQASTSGTATWSGSGCATNPVLGVSTNGSGVINAVTSVITPGQCTTSPSSSSTSWTTSIGVGGGSGASFALSGAPSVTISYTTVSGDTLATAATAIAATFNANSTFTGAGFYALANQANAGPGSVLFSNSSAGIPFTAAGSGSNGIVGYSPLHNVVAISDASNNKVEIGSITGGAITGAPVSIGGGTATNEAPTSGNDIVVAQSALSYQNSDVTISGAGAVANTVHDGWYHGPTFQPKAFWVQYGSGAYNEISRVKSDSPGGYPWCDQSDFSNRFDDVYATMTAPRANSYGGDQRTYYCSFERVTSAAISRYLSLHNDYIQTNATASGGFSDGTQSYASPTIEEGDGMHITMRAILSGTAGVKTGSVTYQCNVMNWSIPSDATSADVVVDCSHWGPGLQAFCTMKITSNSTSAPFQQKSGSGCFGQAFYGAAVGANATTGADTLAPFEITFSPHAPTYSSAQRP